MRVPRWFKRSTSSRPPAEEQTAFSDQEWPALVTRAMQKAYNQAVVVEASRRVVRALDASERSATNLGTISEVRSSPGLVEIELSGQTGNVLKKIVYWYQCWPDTVDPRRPKGK